MTTVGFACFGMNLVGVGEDGKPCTPVFTYAANSHPSPLHSSSAPTPAPSPTGEFCFAGCPPVEDDVMKRLRGALERTGFGGKGGLEEARRRTGAPTHVSYAPAQLLRWLQRTSSSSSSSTAPVASSTVATGEGEREREGEGSPRVQQQRRVRVWQTLPSLIAARWCRLASAPVSYSEASWMGLLDLRRLEVRRW